MAGLPARAKTVIRHVLASIVSAVANIAGTIHCLTVITNRTRRRNQVGTTATGANIVRAAKTV